MKFTISILSILSIIFYSTFSLSQFEVDHSYSFEEVNEDFLPLSEEELEELKKFEDEMYNGLLLETVEAVLQSLQNAEPTEENGRYKIRLTSDESTQLLLGMAQGPGLGLGLAAGGGC